MIRSTIPADIDALVALTDATGFFKPFEIDTLREVLADYFAEEQALGHRCVTSEEGGVLQGFAYYAHAPMTDRAWNLWWIAVRTDVQARGHGTALLQHVEDDIRQQQGRVLFIETSSQPRYEPTRQFYLKKGYDQHAQLADFYAAGDSMVVFRKAL